MIDSNQAYLAKMTGRGFQEVIFRKGDEDLTYETSNLFIKTECRLLLEIKWT